MHLISMIFKIKYLCVSFWYVLCCRLMSYDRFYKVQIENQIFILSFRFVKLLKYRNMHVETEKVSTSYIHRYSWPCRWGYELSFWRQRGVVMAWRIGRSCICLFWSNWTGNAFLKNKLLIIVNKLTMFVRWSAIRN